MTELLLVLGIGLTAVGAAVYLLWTLGNARSSLSARNRLRAASSAQLTLTIGVPAAVIGIMGAVVVGGGVLYGPDLGFDRVHVGIAWGLAFVMSVFGGLLVGALGALAAPGLAADASGTSLRRDLAVALGANAAGPLVVATLLAALSFVEPASRMAPGVLLLAPAPLAASLVARLVRITAADAQRGLAAPAYAVRAVELYEIGVGEGIVSSMLAGGAVAQHAFLLGTGLGVFLLPLVLRTLGLVASVVGGLVGRRDGDERPAKAYGRGLHVAAMVAAVGSAGAVYGTMGDEAAPWALCAGIGLVTSLVLVHTTHLASRRDVRWGGPWMPAVALGVAVVTSYAIGEASGVPHGGPYAMALMTAATSALAAYIGGTYESQLLAGAVARGYRVGCAALVGLVAVVAYYERVGSWGEGGGPVPVQFTGGLAGAVLVSVWWARSQRARGALDLTGPLAAVLLVPCALAAGGELFIAGGAAPLFGALVLVAVVVGALAGLAVALRVRRSLPPEQLGPALLLAALATVLAPFFAAP